MSDMGMSEDELFMEELKQEFKETVSRNMGELYRLYDEEKWGDIAKISHDVKGTSGIFGYDEGTEIARELNVAAKELDLEKIKPLINQLAQYMKDQGIIA